MTTSAKLGRATLGQGDGASPEVFTTIAEVQDISGPGMAVDSLEATSQDSADFHKEFIPGLIDGGEVTFDCHMLPTTASQASLMQLAAARTTKNWQLKWTQFGSPAPTATFAGFVTNAEPTSPFADKAMLAITIKVTGKVTLANWTYS